MVFLGVYGIVWLEFVEVGLCVLVVCVLGVYVRWFGILYCVYGECVVCVWGLMCVCDW